MSKSVAILAVFVAVAISAAFARDVPRMNSGVSDFEAGQCINSTAKVNCNPGSHGQVTFLQVCPCTAEPCAFVPGSNATMTVGFIAGEAATQATGSVHALVGPSRVVFPLANPNGCTPTGGNLDCPLVPGKEYVYVQTLTIPSYAPGGVTVLVEWELLDQNNQDIWCFEEPVRTA